MDLRLTVHLEEFLHLKNCNKLKFICSDNPCTTEGTVIHMNPSVLHGKNLRSATQLDST